MQLLWSHLIEFQIRRIYILRKEFISKPLDLLIAQLKHWANLPFHRASLNWSKEVVQRKERVQQKNMESVYAHVCKNFNEITLKFECSNRIESTKQQILPSSESVSFKTKWR